jgi:nicotinamidase-related amidase
MDRLEPESSLLLVVDVQERLAAAMPQSSMELLVANAGLLLEAARLLSVPVVASEQYPKGLGPTVVALADRLRSAHVQPIDKLSFDAVDEPRVAHAISAHSPRAVVVVGMETHVCVFQTARHLARRGYVVYVVADAVASRREEHRTLGLSLCERAGAVAIPAESVVFDWLRFAGTNEFKKISRLLR